MKTKFWGTEMGNVVLGTVLAALTASSAFAATTNSGRSPFQSSANPAVAVKGSTQLDYRGGGVGVLNTSKNIASVSEPATGVFCITLKKPIGSGQEPTVTVEWGSSSGSSLLAYLEYPEFDCAAGQLEVRTYDFNAGGAPVASDNVAFILWSP